MYRIRLFAMVLVTMAGANICSAGPGVAPKIDKTSLEAYLRYAEGFTPSVGMAIDDPVPSAYPGFYRLAIHVTSGNQKLQKQYYVSEDGQHIFNGSVWKLGQTPFLDTLAQLPTDGPSFGPADAKVTIVVFSDFQCPYCRQLAQTLRQNVPQKYPKDVRIFFEDFPLESIHNWARAAAEAGRCLANIDSQAFWSFHDWAFEHQGEITDKNLTEKVLGFAKEKNLDSDKIAACMSSHATAAQVAASEAKGELLQVQQTPTFFINGRLVGSALRWEALDGLIQYELNRPKAISLPGLAR